MSPRRSASSKDVAAALGVSTATVQGYARAGRIPFSVTPGGHRRFDVAEVQLALEPSIAESTSPLRPLAERSLAFGATQPGRTTLLAHADVFAARPEGGRPCSHRPLRDALSGPEPRAGQAAGPDCRQRLPGPHRSHHLGGDVGG